MVVVNLCISYAHLARKKLYLEVLQIPYRYYEYLLVILKLNVNLYINNIENPILN